ncbi:acetylornithine deacetylase [Zhengella sp. ZM62]|uniref:acetylornithine deacetylase n=1 Tax=Zhengella sedimenti TaxID=3390035 RepID=UPI003974BB95
MSPLDRTVAILADLIAYPTVSADSNLALIAHAAERLGDAGAAIQIHRDPTGEKANLFATIGPDRPGGVVLSGHTDVVPALEPEWEGDPFAMRQDGGRLYGRGTCDMKGFIACMLAMAQTFAARDLARPVHFALTYDEEVGCLGARQLVQDLAAAGIRPSAAIIGEPTNMRMIEGHKGCCEYTTRFKGLEGHGSDPDAGVNAIEYAVRYAARLAELGRGLRAEPVEGSRFRPPFTTVQIGRIEGGAARNVIAGDCMIEWEMRPVRPDDAGKVKRALQLFCDEVLLPEMRSVSPGCSIETEVIGEVAGLEPVADNEARDIVARLTGANDCDVVAFGTEAGLFQEFGMSAIVCGPGSIEQAHKPNEYVAVSELEKCLSMLDGLAGTLSR